jgi:hypothetical protein
MLVLAGVGALRLYRHLFGPSPGPDPLLEGLTVVVLVFSKGRVICRNSC